jgi:oligogalacturonide lyase
MPEQSRSWIALDVLSGRVRRLTEFPVWHGAVNRQGNLIVTDTTFSDTGLHVMDLHKADSPGFPLCRSDSSNIGSHWSTDRCPYDDGPIHVHAPQHTHPHPGFSPDGRRVVFTSDRTGFAQVYVAELPARIG